MNQYNPFSDDPSFQEAPKSNTAATVLIVLAIIGGSTVLLCGGMMVGGMLLAQKAQRDFDEVMQELDESDGMFQANNELRRYARLNESGQYEQALAELDKGLANNPDNAMLHNGKAWMLATCPDEAIRDGELAVEHGKKACELTNWENSACVDTVAAAYAEAGDYDAAVMYQQQAIELAAHDNWPLGDFRYRLELYKSHTPYREGIDPATGQRVPPPAPSQPSAPAADDSTAPALNEI